MKYFVKLFSSDLIHEMLTKGHVSPKTRNLEGIPKNARLHSAQVSGNILHLTFEGKCNDDPLVFERIDTRDVVKIRESIEKVRIHLGEKHTGMRAFSTLLLNELNLEVKR